MENGRIACGDNHFIGADVDMGPYKILLDSKYKMDMA